MVCTIMTQEKKLMIKNLFKRSDFFELIKKGNIKKVEESITEKIFTERNAEYNSPMEVAILSNQLAIVELFVEKGASIPTKINDIAIIHKMIQDGCKNYELIKYIINKSENINQKFNGISALAECMKSKRTDFKMVTTLLKLGSDVNVAADHWLTPLVLLIKNDEKSTDEKIEMLKLFEEYNIEFKAKKNPFFFTETRTNLYLPVLQHRNYKLFIQLLRNLKNITDDEMEDIKGYINISNFNGKLLPELLDTISELALNIFLPASCYNDTELSKQLDTRDIETMQKENFLLELCININITFDAKKTLIEKYIMKDGKLSGGKAFGKDDRDKFNLLGYLACFDKNNENLKIIEFLIDRGAKIEDDGESALFASLWFAKEEHSVLFLKKGANVHFITQNGDTVFTKLGVSTIQGNESDYNQCFSLMKMVYSSISDLNTRHDLMQKPYKYAYEYVDKPVYTNPFCFFVFTYKTDIEMQVLEYYLENGYDINTRIEYEGLEFYIPKYIFNSSNTDFAMNVLKKYEDIDVRDLDGFPYVLNFLKDKNYKYIEMLICRLKDINQKFISLDQNATLLEHSLYNSNSDETITNIILDNFSDVDVDSWRVAPPIIHAFRSKYKIETIGKMIKKSKNIDNRFYHQVYTNCKPSHLTPLAYICSGQKFYEKSRELSDDKTYEYILQVAQLLISYGADVNSKFSSERLERKYAPGVEKEEYSILERAFHLADNYQDVGILELLFENGIDITNTTGAFKSRIEHFLTLWGNFTDEKIIEYFKLLKKYRPNQLDLNIRTNTGANTVLAAAQHCRPKLIKWLIDNGADQFMIGGHDNSNAIDRAISVWPDKDPQDRANTVKVLLDAGLDIEIKNPQGQTPLITAAEVGALDTVDLLLKNGADVNAQTNDGENAISFAVKGAYDYQFKRITVMNESNKVRIINLLCKYGANINCVPSESLIPLGWSIISNYNEIFEHLIRLGADINLKDFFGYTPLMRTLIHNNTSARRYLLYQDGLDLMETDRLGKNILFYQAEKTNSEEAANEFAQYFNEFKVPYIKNNLGEYPLFYAVNGNLNMTKMILDLTNDTNINCKSDRGDTPLLIACGKFYLDGREEYEDGFEYEFNASIRKEIIAILIEKGADVNYKNTKGESAMDIAVAIKSPLLIEFLTSKGANQKNKIGFN